MNRNIKSIVAAALVTLSATAAFAGEDLYYGVATGPVVSSSSRLAVAPAERSRSQADAFAANDLYHGVTTGPVASTTTRAQVKADLAQARADGSLNEDLYHQRSSQFRAKPRAQASNASGSQVGAE